MKIKTITATAVIFLSFFAIPVFAATQYGNITIDENTTAAQFIIYLFNFGIALGALAAVIMMVMAGIEWVTSSGNPSKIESAKGKIVNTLFGIAVLVGCYLILKTINDNLTTVKIDDLYCDHGIIAKVLTSEGKEKQKCIDTNLTDIEKSVGGKVQSVTWKFPKDYLFKVYTYPEVDYKGTPTEINCSQGTCNGNIAGAKSIYFVLNRAGIYLYDGTSFKPGVKSFPLFTSTSIPDLSKTSMEFDNYTKSIERNILMKEDDSGIETMYYAVVFQDPNYEGRCAFIGMDVPDMSMSINDGKSYSDTIGNDTVSSIIVAAVNPDENVISKSRGEVILYTKDNCGKSDATASATEIKACHIPVDNGDVQGLQNINDLSDQYDCKIKLGKGNSAGPDTIMSFEITGDIGIVLSTSEVGQGSSGTLLTSGTRCKYFDPTYLKGSNCFSKLEGTNIYTTGGINPKSIIIIPKS
ncbi:MAG TPA: pilin [Candidatus Pacearchaeota archaeon]|nr:pilin [Candidatus Pacearchaeota archaeon]HPR79761.1 pilin [Candidatus Pacearchaeota archaeon]